MHFPSYSDMVCKYKMFSWIIEVIPNSKVELTTDDDVLSCSSFLASQPPEKTILCLESQLWSGHFRWNLRYVAGVLPVCVLDRKCGFLDLVLMGLFDSSKSISIIILLIILI